MLLRILLPCLALAGCAASAASTPASAPPRHEREVDLADGARFRLEGIARPGTTLNVAMPAESVLAALPAVYEELGLTGGAMDAEARVFGTPALTVRRRLGGVALSRYLDCGTRLGLANADAYAVRLAVSTRVTPEGPGASVRTEVQATAREMGRNDPPVRCGTTSELERRIAEMVARP